MARIKKYITKTSEKARANAFIDGRGRNQAYTSGARTTASAFRDKYGKSKTELQGMKDAWNSKEGVQTYTSSKRGRLSVDGQRAGGHTWTFTKKAADGKTTERQSGRSKIASRRQRYYDIRVGLGLAGG